MTRDKKPRKPKLRRELAFRIRPGETLEFFHDKTAEIRVKFPPHVRVKRIPKRS